ncbi:glutaredoxin domain-containing protein [Thioalkalivibrio sp. ALE19]|uniref:glutaredoxin domain-containing protein n=1 Tax=Thioalkalivibrio sp. ALE19 TaxID=1266909 RepID=UPI000410FD60|nr:glutaredoxin domain-containing protein [Thioalkalivibrio sp. ALE19]
MMTAIRMYYRSDCPYCERAERLLERRGLTEQLEKIEIADTPESLAELERITGQTEVPQIYFGEDHVGGFEELVELDMDGELEDRLPQAGNG